MSRPRLAGAVLVTGGAGYIGSHICKMVAEVGGLPICLDTLEKGHEWAVRWGPLMRGDIGDAGFLEAVFMRYRPKIVIHCAGYIEVGESVASPERYYSNNAAKSGVFINAAMRHEVEAFVFSSTCAVYGTPQSALLDEFHPIAPLNPYAESKARVEKLLQMATQEGFRSVSLRYFNAAGSDAAGQIGEAHDPETHLVPLAIDAALHFRAKLVIHGSDYQTDDGSCIRDYVHVTDLATAHMRAVHWLMEQAPEGGRHDVFNLGSGCGHSVKQVIELIGDVLGRPVPHSIGPRRAGDSPQLVGSIAKASQSLGWRPVRDLRTQIQDAARWREEYHQRQRVFLDGREAQAGR